jgi:hypothetical protein
LCARINRGMAILHTGMGRHMEAINVAGALMFVGLVLATLIASGAVIYILELGIVAGVNAIRKTYNGGGIGGK